MPLIFISPFFVHNSLFPCHFHFSNAINGQSRLILRPLSAIFPILDFVMIYAVGFDCGGSFLHMTWKGTTNQKYDKFAFYCEKFHYGGAVRPSGPCKLRAAPAARRCAALRGGGSPRRAARRCHCIMRANLFLKMPIWLSPFFDCIMRATYFYFALFCASPHIPVPFVFFQGHKRPVLTQLAAPIGPFYYCGLRDDLCSLR